MFLNLVCLNVLDVSLICCFVFVDNICLGLLLEILWWIVVCCASFVFSLICDLWLNVGLWMVLGEGSGGVKFAVLMCCLSCFALGCRLWIVLCLFLDFCFSSDLWFALCWVFVLCLRVLFGLVILFVNCWFVGFMFTISF